MKGVDDMQLDILLVGGLSIFVGLVLIWCGIYNCLRTRREFKEATTPFVPKELYNIDCEDYEVEIINTATLEKNKYDGRCRVIINNLRTDAWKVAVIKGYTSCTVFSVFLVILGLSFAGLPIIGFVFF